MNGNTNRVQEIEGLVRYHADLYFNKTPEITDAEFDALVAELKSLSPDSPVLGEVGAVPSYGKKVTHERPMGSLEKAKAVDEVEKWLNGVSHSVMIAVTPKMDGVACSLRYKDGILVLGATRGNGEVGQDITDNIRAIASIPKKLASKFSGEVRGEGYMSRTTFQELNERAANGAGRSFANPRNAASGSMTCQDPRETGSRNLSFMAYDVFPDDDVFKDEKQKRGWMATHLPGIELVPMEIVSLADFAAVAAKWERERPALDYEIDGLVLALESIDEQEAAGFNGHNPNGKLAFKFKPEQKTAKLLAIDWQVGRTGRLTPVARIEPTFISGSTVSNLTLHNAANVTEMDIVPGDDVLIEKAGEIIPQVVRVVEKGKGSGRAVTMIDKCPVCGTIAAWDVRNVNLWCMNVTCPAKLEERILHWLKTMEVLGVGSSTVHGLCDKGYVKSLPDIYFISRDQAAEVTGGERAAEKAVMAILEKNQIPLWQFLDGLGIDGLGTTTSKDVAKEFKTLAAVRGLASKTPAGQEPGITWLTTIQGIGRPTAVKICEGLADQSGEIDRLIEAIEVIDVKEAKGPLVGKSFCMTGSLPSGTKREAMAKRIEAAGGEVRSSVGKGLTYLIQADPNSTSSKSEKARKLGVQVIGEPELEAMMV